MCGSFTLEGVHVGAGCGFGGRFGRSIDEIVPGCGGNDVVGVEAGGGAYGFSRGGWIGDGGHPLLC